MATLPSGSFSDVCSNFLNDATTSSALQLGISLLMNLVTYEYDMDGNLINLYEKKKQCSLLQNSIRNINFIINNNK